MFLDTQIISNTKKGKFTESIRGAYISSIVASELLLVYSEKRTSARYYVPIVNSVHGFMHSVRRDHPPPKRCTDQIIFDFANDFEPLIEFGSYAVSKLVNEGDFRLLRSSIAGLDSKFQRIIREDFEFLIDNSITCYPVRASAIRIAHRLLASFQSSGEVFRGAFRNTWNDLLILATAWDHNATLRSKDSQLNRLAGSQFGLMVEIHEGGLLIRFPATNPAEDSKSQESKEYINRGWQYFSRNRGQQAW